MKYVHWIALFFIPTALLLAEHSVRSDITYKVKKVVLDSYMTERERIDTAFDFFVCHGSKKRIGRSKKNILLTYDKLVLKEVFQAGRPLGTQFFFHFDVKKKDKSKHVVFVINEPQNPLIEEYMRERSVINVFGYQVEFLEMNFSISQNSIRLKVSHGSL